jgi:uncharacterized protein YbjT (DUF2867 family)
MSTMVRILVIGATGNIGRQVVSQLAASGETVRALTRNPASLCLQQNIEVLQGDLTVPESLEKCLQGIEAVFMVWTAPPAAFGAVLERIAKHAKRLVFLSAPLKTPHPFFQQPNPSRANAEHMERLIEVSGLDWTFLRPGMFALNSRFWWGSQIRAGSVVRWPYLSVPTAPIHEHDVAAVAVRVIREERHAGAEYVLTGPQSLTQLEQVSTIGRAAGHSLRIEEITPAEARQEMSATMPASVVNMLLDAWSAAIGQPAFVTSTVEEITGTPARTFLDWALEHARDFQPEATRSS